MLTFSVNKEQQAMYSDKMLNFLAKFQQGTSYTAESISEIVDKIVKDRVDEDIEDISVYSKEIHRLQELKRAEKENIDLKIAVDSLVSMYDSDYQSSSVYTVDTYDDLYRDSIIEDFLLMREKIYRGEGKDIYRLLELSLLEDKMSIRDVQKLCSIYDELAELIYEVITYNVFEQIQDILA